MGVGLHEAGVFVGLQAAKARAAVGSSSCGIYEQKEMAKIESFRWKLSAVTLCAVSLRRLAPACLLRCGFGTSPSVLVLADDEKKMAKQISTRSS